MLRYGSVPYLNARPLLAGLEPVTDRELYPYNSLSVSIAQALSNLAYIETVCGNQDAAIDYGKQAVSAGRATGNARVVCFAESGLSRAHRDSGDLEAAAAAAERSLEAAERCGDRAFEAVALLEWGCTDDAAGRTANAIERLRLAREIADARSEPQVGCMSRLLLARLGAERLDDVLPFVLDHLSECGGGQALEARLLLWQLTSKREHLEQAYAGLRHVRDHAPPEFRKSLLENVPVHRTIVSEYAGSQG